MSEEKRVDSSLPALLKSGLRFRILVHGARIDSKGQWESLDLDLFLLPAVRKLHLLA